MSRRRLATLVAVSGFALAAVVLPRDTRVATPVAAVAVQENLPASLSDSAFAALIARISEPAGYFDTDNLISNEASYLHVLGKIEELNVKGGAYIGVGPDQNYSYIAAVRPRVAFILDIRRDNLLQHLWFKALMHYAPTRVEYLALMFGRAAPRSPEEWRDRTVADLIVWLDGERSDPEKLENAKQRVREHLTKLGLPLSDDDFATIGRIHSTFANAGLDLRYSSHGRPPRASYPSYRQLMLETDRRGRQANYLASEQAYAYVRELHERNLLVPVTGDFAGDRALREIGVWLRERDERVHAFYASNVEFYLMQDRTFPRFAANVATLPIDSGAVIIRSLFGRIYGHPQSLPNYNSTQLLQSLREFVSEFRAGAYATYGDLVYRTYIDLR